MGISVIEFKKVAEFRVSLLGVDMLPEIMRMSFYIVDVLQWLAKETNGQPFLTPEAVSQSIHPAQSLFARSFQCDTSLMAHLIVRLMIPGFEMKKKETSWQRALLADESIQPFVKERFVHDLIQKRDFSTFKLVCDIEGGKKIIPCIEVPEVAFRL
jgi:hypothetical protein